MAEEIKDVDTPIDDTPVDDTLKDTNDFDIKIKALEETLNELKETNKNLTEQLNSTKLLNEKMLLKMNVGTEDTHTAFSMFNRYKK